MDAARELFVQHGYSGTRTRWIADRAGVTEPAIYRHFGSKAGLFESVVVEPFAQFIDGYVAEAVQGQPLDSPAQELVTKFVRGFFALLREHKSMLLTIIAVKADSKDNSLDRIASDIGGRFADAMSMMQKLLLEQGNARHYRNIDPVATWAATVGMIFSMVLHEDWLYPVGQVRPTHARQEQEVVTMILHGISHRP